MLPSFDKIVSVIQMTAMYEIKVIAHFCLHSRREHKYTMWCTYVIITRYDLLYQEL